METRKLDVVLNYRENSNKLEVHKKYENLTTTKSKQIANKSSDFNNLT